MAALPNKERPAAREELAQDPSRLLEMSEGGKRVLEKMTGDAAQPAKAEGAEKPARTVEASQPTAAKDGEQKQDEPEPVLAPTAPAVKAATENGTAEAVQLSPDAKKALSFIEQRIEAQMGNLTREVKAELREHAAQALTRREA